MKRRLAQSLGWIGWIVLASMPAAAQPEKPAVSDWIAANAIRLSTPEAGHGFADMQPLKKVVGNARIVSLGEATHGTREFFQLKHRMLEFLATEMGFTIFSIEASMPEAYKLNDYVLNGQGDPAALIKGMYFWTWDTQEVLEMVKWMRAFNQSGKGRVEFTGFDMQFPKVAAQIVTDFAAKREPGYVETLHRSADMAANSRPAQTVGTFGTATGSFPVKESAGKRVHYSGYIKTQDVSGFAGLWWRVDGASGALAFDNMQERGPKGTTDWKKYEIDLPVAADARNINFGMLISGSGTAWFDGLSVELDGKPYQDPDFDFDFESASVKGFGPAFNGYTSLLDGAVFHSGKQSLQIKRVAPMVAPETAKAKVDSKDASAVWKDVVSHLESQREVYLKAEASAKEIDWAIQNARVVQQCMQMQANEVSRDTSMAANVKWILDHSPGAKIVLWAHNGHVSAGGGGYASMGASLRKMYGDQMVVFGFAFNQGMFQAVSQGKGGLKEFTVPPAPEGSLDATLAAAKIPLFALDLRPAQAGGKAPAAVAAWFGEPHKTRSIGAIYPEDSPFAFMANLEAPKSFDALLFVEKTTAARKNVINGSAKTSEYRDVQYGVAFQVPDGWRVGDGSRWGDRQTTVPVVAPQKDAFAAVYFQIHETPRQRTVEEFQQSLPKSMDSKVRSRLDAGMKDYRLRPDSCTPKTVGGRAALTCLADYEDAGTAMVEYIAYVESEKATALVFARIGAAEVGPFREGLDKIVETVRIP